MCNIDNNRSHIATHYFGSQLKVIIKQIVKVNVFYLSIY